MRTTAVLLTALILALPAAAQTTKNQSLPKAPAPGAPVAPVITDALAKDFFKAQSQMIQSAAQAKEAQTRFQTSVASLQAVCGETSTLQMNQNGDPACVLKPTAKK